MLHLRERELTALRGALEEEISAHARDVLILKEMHQREVHKLLQATEEAKEARNPHLTASLCPLIGL